MICGKVAPDEPGYFEQKKVQLEIEKLKKEIDNSQKPWWVRSVYLSILAPLLVASITVAFNFFNGVYDVEARLKRAELDLLNRKVEEVRILSALESLAASYCGVFEDYARLHNIIGSGAIVEELGEQIETLRQTAFILQKDLKDEGTNLSLDNINAELDSLTKRSFENLSKIQLLGENPKMLTSEILTSYDFLCVEMASLINNKRLNKLITENGLAAHK